MLTESNRFSWIVFICIYKRDNEILKIFYSINNAYYNGALNLLNTCTAMLYSYKWKYFVCVCACACACIHVCAMYEWMYSLSTFKSFYLFHKCYNIHIIVWMYTRIQLNTTWVYSIITRRRICIFWTYEMLGANSLFYVNLYW